jgi:hypothetical protein
LLRYCAGPPFAAERLEELDAHRLIYHLFGEPRQIAWRKVRNSFFDLLDGQSRPPTKYQSFHNRVP